jgi:hypothetical protein
VSEGPIEAWSTNWASETLAQARTAVTGLKFGAETNGLWTVPLDGHYDDSMAPIKKQQLTEAGARLAQTLSAIWR